MDNDMKELVEELLQGFGIRYGRSARHHGRRHEPHERLHGGRRHAGPGRIPQEELRGRAHPRGRGARQPQQLAQVRRARGRHLRIERLHHTYLFDALRPTPELSFAIRELKCHSGVVITASHNPKEYNGYKAYWTDGAQVTAPTTATSSREVGRITDVGMIPHGLHPENIVVLGEDFDEKYLDRIHELSLSPESVKRRHDMKIVYTPLHAPACGWFRVAAPLPASRT